MKTNKKKIRTNSCDTKKNHYLKNFQIKQRHWKYCNKLSIAFCSVPRNLYLCIAKKNRYEHAC